jgi:hypothetical protein
VEGTREWLIFNSGSSSPKAVPLMKNSTAWMSRHQLIGSERAEEKKVKPTLSKV